MSGNFYFFVVLGTVLYANEFEANEKQKLTEIKNLLQHFHMWCSIDGNMIASLTEHV